MIREALIGTALIGGGGYYMLTYSASAEVVRTVKATPHDTWRPFDLILNQSSQQFAAMSEGRDVYADGSRVTPPIVVSVPGREIDFRLQKDGAEAVHVRFGFEPLADGAQTRMTIQVDVAASMVSHSSAQRLGGSMGLKRALEKMADELIPQIESGKLVQAAEAFTDMQRQMAANPAMGQARMYEEEYKRREAQAAASAPMLDPNKAALDPKGASVEPMVDRDR